MLKVTKITFPGLFPNLEMEVDSVAFKLFGHEFPWYAIFITLGIIFCFFYTIYRARRVGIIPDHIIDIGIVAVICGIIGARAFYVATSWDSYKDNLVDIFKIWEGGIAIYGSLIGGAIGVIIVCKIKKLSFPLVADCLSPSLLFAQALGRWGNFFNAEAYGAETDIFCRMGLQRMGSAHTIYVHPTFLYESIWNLLGFILINLLYKKKKFDGQIVCMVFAWYGFARMFIEVLRSDSLYIVPGYDVWYNKISVIIGFLFFLVCTTIIVVQLNEIHHGHLLPLTVEGEPVKGEPIFKKKQKTSASDTAADAEKTSDESAPKSKTETKKKRGNRDDKT